MFFEMLNEILDTIRRNKLRAGITGFSVAWGIFMLIVLLGSGQGVQNGQTERFKDAMHNSLWMFANTTTLPHDGLRPGRKITMRNGDYDMIKMLDGVDLSSSRFSIPGENIISYKGKYNNFEIRTAMPCYNKIEYIDVLEGRFLNEKDSREFRKVAVISTDVRDYFFPKEEAMGKYIKANGISFKIVGIFEDKDQWDNNRCIYIPIEVAQRIFSGGDVISLVSMTMGDLTLDESMKLSDEIKHKMAKRHRFSPDDRRAVWINNNLENFHRVIDMIKAINVFVWVIGIGTIIAGIVGISNIMLISVKERRKEIGIRKAIGARPRTIVGMILLEAIIVTSVAGYIGLLAGVGTLHFMAKGLPETEFFKNPSADFQTAITATIILIISGTLAGYIPARRASKILPIEALHNE